VSARKASVAALFLAAVLAANAQAPDAQARTWRLTPDGTGDAPTIQAAVDSMAVEGDTLVLADGLYQGDGNRDILTCWKHLVIRSEGGSPENCVIDCGGEVGFHFCPTDPYSTEINAEFAGLTIRGAATGVNGENIGLVNRTVRLRIESCVIEDCDVAIRHNANEAIRNSGQNAVMSFGLRGELSITDCRVVDNGGIGVRTSYGPGSTMTIRNSVFARNTLYGVVAKEMQVEGCTFEDNGYSGAYMTGFVGSFNDCDFVRNADGGIHADNVLGIAATRCRFIDNSAVATGGAVGILGVVVNDFITELTLTDCLFSGNSAPQGGAVFCGRGRTSYIAPTVAGRIQGCTFYGNTAGEGSAAYLSPQLGTAGRPSVRISNTIVASNTASEPLFCAGVDTLEVTCSDVYGNDAGDWVGCLAGLDTIPGNISADPSFCDPAIGDFTVVFGSPCVDGPCGRIGAYGQGCVPENALDILPGSCPNEIDLEEIRSYNGDPVENVITAAIIGAKKFDALAIDPTTIRLEGLAATWWNYADVDRPTTPDDSTDCRDPQLDGIRDMPLRFPAADVADVIGDASPGDVVTLTLTATLTNGHDISIADRVIIVDHSADTRDRGPRAVLGPVIPNPANPTARIAYYLPRQTHVDLVIYDVAGRLVARLLDGTMPAGDHEIVWSTTQVASGVYFVRLETPMDEATYKLVVMK